METVGPHSTQRLPAQQASMPGDQRPVNEPTRCGLGRKSSQGVPACGVCSGRQPMNWVTFSRALLFLLKLWAMRAVRSPTLPCSQTTGTRPTRKASSPARTPRRPLLRLLPAPTSRTVLRLSNPRRRMEAGSRRSGKVSPPSAAPARPDWPEGKKPTGQETSQPTSFGTGSCQRPRALAHIKFQKVIFGRNMPHFHGAECCLNHPLSSTQHQGVSEPGGNGS